MQNNMDFNNSLYCRLCAETKPSNKLLDLQQDSARKGDIIEKLNRINASFLDLSLADSLPKTVCFVCTDHLDSALNFLLRIQKAQNVLKSIFGDKLIKEECEVPIDLKPFEYSLASVKDEGKPVKEEYDDDIFDADLEVTVVSTRKSKKKKKKKLNLQDVLDALDDHDLPLSKLKCATWKDYPWLCLYCNSQFFTVSELISHSTEIHNTCMAFRCIDCKNSTKKSLNKFVIHVGKHKKQLKTSCYLCNLSFENENDLSLHRIVHNTDFQCTACNTTFDSFEHLSNHIDLYKKKKVVKKIEEEVACEVCNKRFASSGNLKKHQQIHTVRCRDQTCEKCGKTFYDKGTLTSHMMMHEDSRNHICEICKAGFRTASQLRQHVGIHGGPRPYSCEQCGRTFRLRTHLKSHLIIHTDSLPHICEYCNKAFRFKTILKQHIRQHTGFKPYSCVHCLREFTNWPNYNKHMKRRHSMDMSKKKHTPDGVVPINPVTGQMLPLPNTSMTDEWKKQVMEPKQRGRPKLKDEMKVDFDIQDMETENLI